MTTMGSALFSGTAPLVLFIAKATLVLIAALGAAFMLRRSTAGERHLVWLAALVGLLALPLVSRIPAMRVGILPSGLASAAGNDDARPAIAGTTIIIASPGDASAAPAPVAVVSATAGRELAVIAGTPAAAPLPARAAAASPLPGSILETLAIVWAGVALSLLAWLALGALQVRRIIATAEDLSSPDWTTPLCEVADRLDLEQPPRLVASDRIEMAFACRALSPTVVLPASSASWTDERRRAVLFHELAHVKRRDLVSHALSRVACALYWFHPLVWTAARHLRNESEKACDDLVLSCGARPSEYAQHLLDMVTSVRNHGAPALGIPMARKKEFEGRMLAILDPAVRRASRGRLHAAAVVAGVSALSLTIAAVAPARVDAAPASFDDPATPAFIPASAGPVAPVPSATRGVAVVAPGAVSIAAGGTSSAGSPASAAASAVASAASATSAADDAGSSGARQGAADGDHLSRALATIAGGAIKGVFAGLGISVPTGSGAAADTARIALLIKVLETDSDAGVRRSAAWGLAEAETAAARTALAHALQSDADSQVREMAAWALGEQSGEGGLPALSAALAHDKSAKVRQTAAWSLGQAGRRADAAALTSGLSDADANVRETTIWAFGQLDLDRAPAALLQALGDSSSRIREIAAWTLGQIGDSAAVRPLTRAFESDADARAKSMYLWSLSQIGTAPTSVIESAMKSSDPELRRNAVNLLTGRAGSRPMPMPRPMPRPFP